MQSMVNAVRSTGATNVIMLGGEEYSNDLRQWLSHEPADPDHDLAASWHSYNFNTCSHRSCWKYQVLPVIAQVPVIAGEIGENDCAVRLHPPADALAGLRVDQLPGLGLERRLQLLLGPRADHRLRRPPHGLRFRLPGAPA